MDGEIPGFPTPPKPTGRVTCQMERRWDQAQDFLLLLKQTSCRPTQHLRCEGFLLSDQHRLTASFVVSMPHSQPGTDGFRQLLTAWLFTGRSGVASGLHCRLPLSSAVCLVFVTASVLLGLRGVARQEFLCASNLLCLAHWGCLLPRRRGSATDDSQIQIQIQGLGSRGGRLGSDLGNHPDHT